MLRIFIGTYTKPKSRGIYTLCFDPASGELTAPELAAETVNPTFLALHPSGKCLYAVAEVGAAAGGGLVRAFAIDAATGKLDPLNQQSSGGTSPCHLFVDREGRNLLVANYGSGSVAMLPIGPGGLLAEASDRVQHEGAGPNPKRQEGPHAHSINLDPAQRFALVADLGLDKILPYGFDPAGGKLLRDQAQAASVAPGAGPRHLAFGPAGRFAYVIGELDNTVTVFDYDPNRGALHEVQAVSTLPAGYQGVTWASEVRVHPGGRFLYASNRGHDSIAVFAVDPSSGLLTTVAYEPTLGRTPRHFTFDPTGAWLLAANQATDTLVVFRIDPRSGRLSPVGEPVEVPAPVYVLFAGEAP